MFISPAFAQAGETMAQSGSMGLLLQLALIFVVFYLLLIRPQQKKMRQHMAMLNSIKKGDEIITGGGVYGKVLEAKDDILTVEIANGVVVKASRDMVRGLVGDEKPTAQAPAKKKAANSNKSKK